MAMYKSLFDLSPEQTASTAMPRTVVFSNGTGSGSMTICPLFLGAELYYNDMHLAFFEEATAPMRNVIEINHCRVGRYECSFGANSCCYLAAGDFAVCAAARKKSSSCFPLRHYHGITILLDLDAISPEMRKQMEWYGVDLDVIRRYICTENRCCILRSEPTIAHIFSELYTALHSAFCAGHRLSSAESAGVAAYSDPAEKQGRCAADRVFQSASGGVCEAGCGSSHAGTDSSPYNRTACTGGRPFAYGIKKLFQRHLRKLGLCVSERVPAAAGTETTTRNRLHGC